MPTKSIELVEQYLICKQRGHSEDFNADSRKMPNGEYAHQCEFCKCYFWEERVLHEVDVPTIKLNELKKARKS